MKLLGIAALLYVALQIFRVALPIAAGVYAYNWTP